ncbi:salicylate hydroxylase [Xylariaceae sp. AK1471]|nr:salicylate hydroxylase [Xylariaceae sp. AK1471]
MLLIYKAFPRAKGRTWPVANASLYRQQRPERANHTNENRPIQGQDLEQSIPLSKDERFWIRWPMIIFYQPVPSPRIAIVGAGPAGLALGILLHRHHIPFTIYELRRKPTDADYASHSGMLDLHSDTGLAAIEACGLMSEFQARTFECAEASIVANKDGSAIWSAEGDGTAPEISRHALTKLFLSKLPEECIKWEHKLLSASAVTDSDQFTLDFESQEQGPVVADLVIGADGAWSRTRPLVTDIVPHYSGEQMITVTIPDLTTRYPSLEAFVGAGSLIALGDGSAIISQRGLQGAARLYLVVSTDDENLGSSSGLNTLPPSEVKDLLLRTTITTTSTAGGKEEGKWRNFGTWGPKPKELITRALEDHAATGEALDVRPLYMLPVGQLAWPHRAGVTLLGDAAHLMTPFAGEGVNLALKDALDLARAITRAWDASNVDNDTTPTEECRSAFMAVLDPLIEDFEKTMLARGEEAAAQTWTNLQLFFGEDAAKKVAAIFQG